MRIYLDTCSIQRPMDSKTELRTVVEAEAVLGIVALCESGRLALISSEALVFETRHNPHLVRQGYALEVLALAKHFVEVNERIEAQARSFNEAGIKPLDALHLASAVAAEADYFCTCDDKLLKRARQLVASRTKVVSPLELIEEIDT